MRDLPMRVAIELCGRPRELAIEELRFFARRTDLESLQGGAIASDSQHALERLQTALSRFPVDYKRE